MSRCDLLLVAGEASGDLHAARLLAAVRRRRPEIAAFGLGSGELAAAGAELIADSREISVVGFTEVLRVFERAREIFDRILVEVDRRRPAAAVLVDFPEFNLRLARELAWRGVPVVFYVSPQIWAWRRGRVRIVRDCIDRMLVLFPFELPFYLEHGVRAVHVGHPLVDEVPELEQVWSRLPPATRPDRYRIALLPGSRRSEVDALLPTMLRAIERLAAELPVEVVLVRASSIDPADFEPHLSTAVAPSGAIRVIDQERFAAIAGAHLALCASGTATLETGLLGTPMIVLYRLSAWSWRLARLLVRVPHASLVNLVLERRAVPELLQSDVTPERVAREALRILSSRREVDAIREDLAALRPRLGRPGAAERAADEVLDLLDSKVNAA